LIDWFTIVAQVVNFLILVLLLRRFLYGPIVKAMQEREDRIRDRLQAAEAEHREAEEVKATYRARRRELDERQDRLLAEAREAADARRKELMDRARLEVEEAQSHWREAVRRERELFLSELRMRTGQEVVTIARRALSSLADAELEGQMVRVFLRRLRESEPEQRRAVTDAVRDAGRGVVVRSAFHLPDPKRSEVAAAVSELLEADVPLQFVTQADLVAGIELDAGSYRVAWSLDEHLASLEQDMAEMLADEAS